MFTQAKKTNLSFYHISSTCCIIMTVMMLAGCLKDDDPSSYVQKTMETMTALDENNKKNYEQNLTTFYKTKVPAYASFNKIFNDYKNTAKLSELELANTETKAINVVLSFYNEVVSKRGDAGVSKGDVEDLLDAYKAAIRNKNRSDILKYVNSGLYMHSLMKTDLLPESEKMTLGMLNLGSNIAELSGMGGASTDMSQLLTETVLAPADKIQEATKQKGELIKFMFPTLLALEDISISVVDKQLALIEAEGADNFTVYYGVADFGYGLQIFAGAKSQESIKNVYNEFSSKIKSITPENQKQLFEKRLVEIKDEVANIEKISELLQLIKAYTADLQDAINTNNLQKVKNLIDFNNFANIKSVTRKRNDKNKIDVRYEFSGETTFNTDEKIMGVAKDIVEILKYPSIANFDSKNIIIPFTTTYKSVLIDGKDRPIKTDISTLYSDGYLIIEYANNKLKSRHTIQQIANNLGYSGNNPSDLDLYLKNAESISKELVLKSQEEIERFKARKQLFELMHNILSVSKVEWQVGLGSAYRYASLNLKAIIQNTSDENVLLSKVTLAFIKDNDIVFSATMDIHDSVPAKRGIRLDTRTNLDDEMTYYFSLVDKGELELRVYPNSIRYKGNYYSPPKSEEYMKVEKFGNAWTYKDFIVTELKDTNFSIPQFNEKLSAEYNKKFENSKKENKKLSIELVNKILDDVKASITPNVDHLKLSLTNNTQSMIEDVRISFDFVVDGIIIGSYTYRMSERINPAATEDVKIRVDAKMKKLLTENPQIDAKVYEMEVADRTIERGKASLISGMLMPFLQNKGTVMFKSKQAPPATNEQNI